MLGEPSNICTKSVLDLGALQHQRVV